MHPILPTQTSSFKQSKKNSLSAKKEKKGGEEKSIFFSFLPLFLEREREREREREKRDCAKGRSSHTPILINQSTVREKWKQEEEERGR